MSDITKNTIIGLVFMAIFSLSSGDPHTEGFGLLCICTIIMIVIFSLIINSFKKKKK